MSQDQVVSVRLRRNATSTPWGFRMQGGHEYGSPLYIQQVNPKSLSQRLGLRLGDRLLAIGPVQAHNMSHEQAKMEIIRAGNEVDLIVQRSASAVIDQPDSRPAYQPQPQRTELVEEPTEYRGYTNPNVQSRSFKILQESLNYSEANEEGIVLPTGNTPGEGIVRKAYSEGRRRLEELSEINPRNFTEEGQSPYRVSEHYNTRDESVISESQQGVTHNPNVTVVAAKVYDGSEPRRRKRPTVDVAQSSVLSPAAGQQQYLQQAHEHYQAQPGRPAVNIAHSSVLSPAAGQQQYLQQSHEYYQAQPQTQQQQQQQQQHYQSKPAPAPQQVVVHQQQQTVVHQQKPQERPLKQVNYNFDEQFSHLRKEPSSVQSQQQTQVIQINKQKAVVSPQKSHDFIPATETVSSVAADLDLKIVTQGVASQQDFGVQYVAKPAEQQIIRPVQQAVKPAEQIIKPTTQKAGTTTQITQQTEVVAKPVAPPVKSVEEVAKPEKQIVKPAETVQTVQTAEEAIKPEKQIIKPTEDTGKVIPANPIPTAVAQSETSETNIQVETVQAKVGDTVNKFAEDLSASVVASAQQSIQTPTVTDEPDGCVISKEAPTQAEEEKVEIQPEQQSPSVPEKQEEPTEKQETAEVKSKPVDEELSKPSAEKEESVVQAEPQMVPAKESTDQSTKEQDNKVSEPTTEEEPSQTEVIIKQENKVEEISIDETQLDQETSSKNEETVEVISVPTVVAEESQSGQEKPTETIPEGTNEVIEELTTATKVERRASLQVPETDTEVNVSSHNTDETVSVAAEEVKVETALAVATSDQKTETSTEQTISISTDTQAEEQSFSISVGETSESAELTVDTNEMASESTVAFEISTDADVSLDVSSDVNFTTDVSANTTTDANTESDAAVTLSLGPAADESESANFTLSVTEDESKSTPEVSKPVKKITEPKQKGQSQSKPTKAKFVDSQGGVAARLARFKQK